MSPLSRLLLSRLSKKSVYSTVCQWRAGPKSFALHIDYGVRLCHGSKSCSSGETIVAELHCWFR